MKQQAGFKVNEELKSAINNAFIGEKYEIDRNGFTSFELSDSNSGTFMWMIDDKDNSLRYEISYPFESLSAAKEDLMYRLEL